VPVNVHTKSLFGTAVFRIGQMAGAGGCGDEHSGSIKCGEYLDMLKTG